MKKKPHPGSEKGSNEGSRSRLEKLAFTVAGEPSASPNKPKPVPFKSRHIVVFAYVVRCTAAALISYYVAGLFNPQFQLWAAMTAVNVASSPFSSTASATLEQVAGTLVGVVTGIAVALLASYWPMPVTVQMAVSVCLCALLSARYFSTRMSMWGCMIVLLDTPPGISAFQLGTERGISVILGALMGAGVHFLMQLLVIRLTLQENLDNKLD